MWLGVVFLIALNGSCSPSWPFPVDVADRLQGPVSPGLRIPFGSYALTPDGLLRSYSISGDRDGIDRPIVRTESGLYLSRDFVFEVTVTIPAAHEDIAYVGFGEGAANGAYNNEPTNCFIFRIHNMNDVHRIDAAVGSRHPGKPPLPYFRELHSVANYPPGRPMRVRIERRGERLTMSLPGLPGSAQVFRLGDYPGLFDTNHAYLFLGNTSQGTTFSDLSVTS
jgi:hypothetical protein